MPSRRVRGHLTDQIILANSNPHRRDRRPRKASGSSTSFKTANLDAGGCKRSMFSSIRLRCRHQKNNRRISKGHAKSAAEKRRLLGCLATGRLQMPGAHSPDCCAHCRRDGFDGIYIPVAPYRQLASISALLHCQRLLRPPTACGRRDRCGHGLSRPLMPPEPSKG